ncbi:FKBP-type peptidyl-prolyl cis-trans isomerase [Leptospira sp. GIMC2001]|uniref:FKBP-type peptidyl-prolyl cis-trans isomerase n=1 Tax=Leptospira sp. GIMC2001 TaxID=1513297 RepID=UPI00234ACC6C|nr:peptidylprolyl isomerase [Leptospira sp. GIMC2001]WCL50051.1 peptidylprolyl isomerase [Leptospira sp. GIMC2001]
MSMNVAKGKVVGFAYHLQNSEGETLDESKDPMEYLHGFQNIIPGLEKEMEGLKIGDKKTVTVLPADAYGEYNEELVYKIPRTNFPADEEIQPGMQFRADGEEGPISLFVQEVVGDDVIMNGNHPLAGETLKFDVEIHTIREASAEEMEHGHSHGPGGHHHH